MLFKPEDDKAKTAGKRVARGIGRRFVSLTITLVILGGLGYLGWNAFQQKQSAASRRSRRAPRPAGAGAGRDAPHAGCAGLS